MLTGVVALIPERARFGRTLVQLLISIVWLMALLALKPYKRVVDQWLSVSIAISLILVFVLINLIHVCDASSDVCEGYGLGSDVYPLKILFFILVLMVITLMLSTGIYMLMRTASARGLELKLVSTGCPPVLRRDMGIMYHIFLSHIWISGQDQV